MFLPCARYFLCTTLLSVLAALPVAAQWVGPQEPCDPGNGHFLIRGAKVYLSKAVGSAFERENHLRDAIRVLTQAITDAGQEDNPATWYYLGRYYVIKQDGFGADSAFARALELAPDCEEDVRGHIRRVYPFVRNHALRTANAEQFDSAATFFQLAISLNPDDPSVPLSFGMMYVQQGQLDSAAKYTHMGIEAAGEDSTYVDDIKRGLLAIASDLERHAYEEEALTGLPLLRQARDTLPRSMARDSASLARMMARVNEIRARGRRLDPESRQLVEAESTAVETRLAAARLLDDSLKRVIAADSQKALAAAEPVMTAIREYLDRFPQEVDAATKLLRLLAFVGNEAALDSLVTRIINTEGAEAGKLARAGIDAFDAGQSRTAARMLEASLEKNPNIRNALFTLSQAYYVLRDKEHLMPTANRLIELDPLNPSSVRLMAAAWDLEGNADSVRKYVELANGGIRWNVSISQFVRTGQSSVLNGGVRNMVNEQLPPTTLIFDFLSLEGEVLHSETVEVPALEPQQQHTIAIGTEQGGAAAWKYRRQ